jgi:hypothetical protein
MVFFSRMLNVMFQNSLSDQVFLQGISLKLTVGMFMYLASNLKSVLPLPWIKGRGMFYLLTPWCRIQFEKLIVTQLIKKYPDGSSPCSKFPPLNTILSQLIPVRPIDPYLPNV